jgi:CheY-like chemotaxis protein
VAKALETNPDIIILDIKLPDMSGWEVLAQVKAQSDVRDIPVLVVSVVDDRSRGLALGAAEYLVKPITRRQMCRALSRVLTQDEADTRALVVASDQDRVTSAPSILLAEDNETNIETITDYLLDKGYRVTVARNGREVLERMEEALPDIVLMDIQMPDVDGLEAIRHIRDNDSPAFATIPIIALTALAMPGDRERCLKAGADEYLSKPVSMKGLSEIIEAQLRRSKGEEPSVCYNTSVL